MVHLYGQIQLQAHFPSNITNEFAVRANGGVRFEAGNKDTAMLTVKNLQEGPAGFFSSNNGHSIVTDQPSLIKVLI